MKKRLLSKLLILSLAFTLTVSQGSFAFADESMDLQEDELQTSEILLSETDMDPELTIPEEESFEEASAIMAMDADLAYDEETSSEESDAAHADITETDAEPLSEEIQEENGYTDTRKAEVLADDQPDETEEEQTGTEETVPDKSSLDKVKEAIRELSADPTSFSAADREKVEAIKAEYDALSPGDQAAIDSDTSHPDTGQPLGRVLESALWGIWSYNAVDSSTALADGTYDASTAPALSCEYSKGKSTSSRQTQWSVKSVKVVDGVSSATIKVESESYSDIWMGGVTYHRANSSGNSVFTGVPIDLNSTFYFAGISEKMPTPIAYSITTSIDESAAGSDIAEPAEEETDTELAITNEVRMFKVIAASLVKEEEKEYLDIVLNAQGYHELFKGTKDEALTNGDGTADKGNDAWIHGYINADGKWEFRVPVENGESYIPCVSISNSYYEGYLNGNNDLEKALYPRQFKIDREAKTLLVEDYNEEDDPDTGDIELEITNEVRMFKVVTASIVKEEGKDYLVVALNAQGYHELFKGTKDEALSNGDGTADKGNDTWVHGYTNEAGKWEFRIPLENGESYVPCVSISNSYYEGYLNGNNDLEKALYPRQFKIDREAKTLLVEDYNAEDDKASQDTDPTKPDDPVKPDDTVKPDDPSKPEDQSKPDQKDDSGSDGSSGYAPAVDTSTALKDGEYTPDSFSWSGGTGKLSISCSKITVINGQAYATIVFSSTKVDQLKASGGLYYKQGSGKSVFVIPVNLNENNTIIGRTTAMSSPHWVEYTIYIGLAEGGEQADKANEAKKDAAEAKMKISEEAPVIAGLEAKEEEVSVEYSKYFKIFNYEHGVKMLSIDISEDTELKKEYTENAEKSLENSESAEEVEYDDEGKIITKSKTEYIEDLYKNNVVNYLLVPEDYEVPAGLDKEYIIITIPAEKSFMASPEAIAMMEELGCFDAISLLGIDEKEIKSDELKKAIKDEKVKLAGNLEKPDFAKVVKGKPDVAILPGDLLPEEIDKNAKDSEKEKLAEEAKEKKEALEKLESRFSTLEVPVIIDRSAQEKDELAQAEWIKVYGALFGCEEQAEKIFEKKVKEAENNAKN